MSNLAHRKTEKQKNRKTEKQKDRRTQKFFLLNRVLGVLKRRENTKKVGVRKIFFWHDSNMGRIPFEPHNTFLFFTLNELHTNIFARFFQKTTLLVSFCWRDGGLMCAA
jgi:hypothetical protein